MAELEETLDIRVLIELLIIPTQDSKFLEAELEKLKERLVKKIPGLIKERQMFSAWQARVCADEAEKSVKSPRLRTFFRNLGAKMLGELCLLTKDETLRFEGMGKATFADYALWMANSLPKVSPVVIRALYGRAGVRINNGALIMSLSPELHRVGYY